MRPRIGWDYETEACPSHRSKLVGLCEDYIATCWTESLVTTEYYTRGLLGILAVFSTRCKHPPTPDSPKRFGSPIVCGGRGALPRTRSESNRLPNAPCSLIELTKADTLTETGR